MKWIQVQTAQQQWLSIALNHEGVLFVKDASGTETELGGSVNIDARWLDGGRAAMIALPPPWGDVRTDETAVVDAWFAHLDLSGSRKRKPTPVWVWAWGILASIVL